MKELDTVQLKSDFEGLTAGTQGVIVLQYDNTCYEVEFFDNEGNTVGVYTTPVSVLMLGRNDNE